MKVNEICEIIQKCREGHAVNIGKSGQGAEWEAGFLAAHDSLVDTFQSITEKSGESRKCPFCGGDVDPEGWLDGSGTRGPECETCGATAPDLDTWNSRA